MYLESNFQDLTFIVHGVAILLTVLLIKDMIYVPSVKTDKTHLLNTFRLRHTGRSDSIVFFHVVHINTSIPIFPLKTKFVTLCVFVKFSFASTSREASCSLFSFSGIMVSDSIYSHMCLLITVHLKLHCLNSKRGF